MITENEKNFLFKTESKNKQFKLIIPDSFSCKQL